MNAQAGAGGAVARVNPSGGGGLGDILDRVLDKGIVIDAWASVSLLGIEIVGIHAQVVVASVETYLKYAAAASGVSLPSTAAPKKEITVEASKPAEAPAPAAPKALPAPNADDLVKYLNEHQEGLRLEEMAEHFHAPPEQLTEAVGHLVSERKISMDQARALFASGSR